jgi:DNA-binding MarR family transcriptional regulator
VGDFLLGALLLRGAEPIEFSELGRVAAESGLDTSQVLNWIARAEEGGLIERVAHDEEPDGRRALRLTPAGTEIAFNNRRRGR